MKITIESEDRVDLLKYINMLREFNCNTSEKLPISYEHICEIESLMYKLANLLQFEQPDRGGWYIDYRLKEELEKEKNNDK
tara:strand:- start:101 stop:343 length:243 start_codon:yes stop_codon:yes gene_type:complete